MKVTDLTLTMFKWDIPHWRSSGVVAFGGEKQLGVVTIHTDQGVDGHSFLGSAREGADTFARQLIDLIKPVVLGRNPLDIGALWGDMWRLNRFVAPKTIGAVDVALWDIAGKLAGMPIHRLLGSCKSSMPAYASSVRLPTPEDYVEEALRFRSEGWTAYKMHPHGVPKEDIAISQAVRKAVGDDMVLMLDSMWAYNYEQALKVGRAIEELDYFWYEDPLAEDDIYGYVKLHQKLDIPIMATEHVPGGVYSMAQWVLQGATDILRGDVAVNGGITPLMKIAHLAETFRMRCEIHHGGNSLNNVANLHVMMAIPNSDYYEFYPASGANKYGLVADIEVDAQGRVHAPETPGLGYEIDWELVNKDKIQVLR